MRRNEHVWWVSATVLSLTAFSFFAGLGLRGLYERLGDRGQSRESSITGYPRVASANPRIAVDRNLQPLNLYIDVLKKLQAYYVEDAPPAAQLSYGSIDAMLNQLNDPNTRLLSRPELEAMQKAPLGEFPGLGAVLTIRRHGDGGPAGTAGAGAAELPIRPSPTTRPTPAGIRTITVVSVAPGGPAEKAGLKSGDRITEFDGRWIAPAHLSYRVITQLTDPLGPQDGRPRSPDEMPEDRPVDPEREKDRKEADEVRRRWQNATDLTAAMKSLAGGTAGEHELTVERGKPTKTLKIKVRLDGVAGVPVFAFRSMNPTTGYVQLLAFSAATPGQMGQALADFQKAGIRNLVVDLRGSAGGSLEAARDVAGLLIGNVKFAVLKERDAERKLVDRALIIRGATIRLKPSGITVLVDGGTAGSSELLAAALRDHLGARLVGSTTFGDGTEQDVVRLDDSAGLSITRARMLTSLGGDFDGKGLKPDVAPAGDALEAAVKALPLSGPATKKKGA